MTMMTLEDNDGDDNDIKWCKNLKTWFEFHLPALTSL